MQPKLSKIIFIAILFYSSVHAQAATQTISLDQGWNMFSFNVLPANIQDRYVDQLLSDIDDKIIMANNENGSAWWASDDPELLAYFAAEFLSAPVDFGDAIKIKKESLKLSCNHGGATGSAARPPRGPRPRPSRPPR